MVLIKVIYVQKATLDSLGFPCLLVTFPGDVNPLFIQSRFYLILGNMVEFQKAGLASCTHSQV